MSFPNQIGTGYSTTTREFQPVVPANSQTFSYASTEGSFRCSRLGQTNIRDVLKHEPVDTGHMSGPYDVSISEVLAPLWKGVGLICFQGHVNDQFGTCTLIGKDLALIPYHCIEDIDVRQLQVYFGYFLNTETTDLGNVYTVEMVVEADPDLDYAIIKLGGDPGKKEGIVPISTSSSIYAQPALLHYPLAKPLKASIHTFVQSNFAQNLLNTYHDSDYGSSGGTYISPSGTMVAMHLGLKRQFATSNVSRLALPLHKIREMFPNGILNRIAKGTLDPMEPFSPDREDRVTYFLSPFERESSYIDFEAYDKARFGEDGRYILREPSEKLPAVFIDKRQSKHSLSWDTRAGGSGEVFPIGKDDTVLLAEKLMEEYPEYFDDPSPDRPQVKTQYWDIDKKALGKELFKKLKNVRTIGINPVFEKDGSWEFHFFPFQKKGKK